MLIEAEGLAKVYRRGAEEVRAVDHVTFGIAAAEFVAIVGPSGSGKTTLLQLMGAMDVPTRGSLKLAGRAVNGLSDGALTRLRREEVCFVFQHFGLLPSLTVEENVALPMLFNRRRAKGRVGELLERVGLSHRRRHRPAELSGGEMQRAAIARSLINSPRLLLADEPTGNLDSVSSAKVFELLHGLNQRGLTVVVVTHNEALAQTAGRRLRMEDGRLTPE